MVGSTGTAVSSDPRVGMTWSSPISSSVRPRTFAAFCASSLFIVIWPSRAAVVHTGLRPTSLASCAQVRPFFSLIARTFSVSSARVIAPPPVPGSGSFVLRWYRLRQHPGGGEREKCAHRVEERAPARADRPTPDGRGPGHRGLHDPIDEACREAAHDELTS